MTELVCVTAVRTRVCVFQSDRNSVCFSQSELVCVKDRVFQSVRTSVCEEGRSVLVSQN